MCIYVRLPRLMSLAPERFASLPSKEREKGRFPEALDGRACSRFSDQNWKQSWTGPLGGADSRCFLKFL